MDLKKVKKKHHPQELESNQVKILVRCLCLAMQVEVGKSHRLAFEFGSEVR